MSADESQHAPERSRPSSRPSSVAGPHLGADPPKLIPTQANNEKQPVKHQASLLDTSLVSLEKAATLPKTKPPTIASAGTVSGMNSETPTQEMEGPAGTAPLVSGCATSSTPLSPASSSSRGAYTPHLYDKLYPYSAFPKHIEGPTVWKPEDYANNPERWVHSFTEAEIAELSATADAFMAAGEPLTGITRENFPLPGLAPHLASMRREMLNGKGFILYKGFPVHEWGNHKSAVAYMGLGAYLGWPVSQNGRGHILGHVKDLDEDSTQTHKVRIYRTNARQFFHADSSDVVGLLCIAKAEFGGESDVASIHHVWNILQAERPDVADLLTQPIWYFDRKGEVSAGEEEYIRTSIFFLETPAEDSSDPSRKEQRVYCKFDPYYVRSLTRFSDIGVIPAMTPAQKEAIQLLEDTCERVKLHMILDIGDIQFVANTHTLHARTAYRDFPSDSGMPRRHLMRLWLALPESEGGWRLPYWDSKEKKRGGIQVDDTPPVARLDAD